MIDRGADSSGSVEVVSRALRKVSEETRIMTMTALDENPDRDSTLLLSYALSTSDEMFIRCVSLTTGFCSDFIRAKINANHNGSIDARRYKNILAGFHDTHKQLGHDRKSLELTDYDPKRDELIANVFKAKHLADEANLAGKVPLSFEYNQHLGILIDNMDDVEAAIPAIVGVIAARRHHAIANKASYKMLSLDAHDLMKIIELDRDYPHSAKRLYDIVVGHGAFDPERMRLALANASPTLAQGVL